MGLFRRKKERAIPQPGSREFDEAVEGPSPPDSEPEKRRRREGLIRALGRGVPNSGGFGAGIPNKPKKKSD
jgi:hypothetical protein